jgi:hypothetical protein
MTIGPLAFLFPCGLIAGPLKQRACLALRATGPPPRPWASQRMAAAASNNHDHEGAQANLATISQASKWPKPGYDNGVRPVVSTAIVRGSQQGMAAEALPPGRTR